jgi:hypothetical protein
VVLERACFGNCYLPSMSLDMCDDLFLYLIGIGVYF